MELYARGKVRDVYAAGDYLVIVATDRLSAFDYVLQTPIPDKGRVLTAMTLFWLEQLRDLVPNHFVSAEVSDYPPEFHAYRGSTGRAVDAGASGQDGGGGVRGARLRLRIRLEGLPA